jgi:hypothetical protein
VPADFDQREQMNRHVRARLDASRRLLMVAYEAGIGLSSATQGREREAFVRLFLAEMLPTVHRFGSGDIIDSLGEKTGQVDVVIEYPFLPSLHSLGLERLYLAESVGAALEVKSDLAKKWDEVVETAKVVKRLTRGPRVTGMYGGQPPTRVPFFAVGYTGWKSLATLEEKVQGGLVDGILIIDAGLFACTQHRVINIEAGRNPGEMTGVYSITAGEDAEALWGFLCCLTEALHGMTPIGQAFTAYAEPEQPDDQSQPPADAKGPP